MVIALNPNAREEYVTKADRELPEGQRTVFSLRPLNVFDRAEVAHRVSNGEKFTVIETVRLALDGWRNLIDERGQPVEFEARKDGRATDECMKRLDETTLVELFHRVANREEVTLDEAGKSDSGGARDAGDAGGAVSEVP